jgi:hypothetical protein
VPTPDPAPQPAPEPEPSPTDTGREEKSGSFEELGAAFDIDTSIPAGQREPAKSFAEKMREMENDPTAQRIRRQWAMAQADGKRHRIPAKEVQRFKQDHHLNQEQPLTDEAADLLRQELEAHRRDRQGERIAIQQHREELQQQATAELLTRLAVTVRDGCLPERQTATTYLMGAMPQTGFKARQKLVSTVWRDLDGLGLPTPPAVAGLSKAQQALYWGVVLRLPHLEGEPPTDTGPFLKWCQFTVTQQHRRRIENGGPTLVELFTGGQGFNQALAVLGFAEGTVVTRKGINDAYRRLAFKHHPDHGGTAAEMHRITAARDRLIQEVSE